jgi:hypothetical protein
MTKSSSDQDIEKTKAIMGRLASMPHKPHVKKKTAKKGKARKARK